MVQDEALRQHIYIYIYIHFFYQMTLSETL